MTNSPIVPAMRYHDAPAAIDWLCNVLGFIRHQVFPGPDNTIAHAELRLGSGMIMLGSVQETEFSKYLKQPGDLGGVETQSCYLVVPDVDVIYEQAKAGGAEILLDIQDQHYGGRDFTCRDPWGHIWSVGTYDPWVLHTPH